MVLTYGTIKRASDKLYLSVFNIKWIYDLATIMPNCTECLEWLSL